MKKNEFIIKHCVKYDITEQTFRRHFIALRCFCGEDECPGWAAVSDEPEAIDRYIDLYSTDARKKLNDSWSNLKKEMWKVRWEFFKMYILVAAFLLGMALEHYLPSWTYWMWIDGK